MSRPGIALPHLLKKISSQNIFLLRLLTYHTLFKLRFQPTAPIKVLFSMVRGYTQVKTCYVRVTVGFLTKCRSEFVHYFKLHSTAWNKVRKAGKQPFLNALLVFKLPIESLNWKSWSLYLSNSLCDIHMVTAF